MQRPKHYQTLYALKIPQSGESFSGESKSVQKPNNLISPKKLMDQIKNRMSSGFPFLLVLGDSQLKGDKNYGWLIEQQISKSGTYLLGLILKQKIQIVREDIRFEFPLSCSQYNGKYIIPEEEFKRLVEVYHNTTRQQGDYSDQSSIQSVSFPSQQNSSAIQNFNKRKGRPKGSKNKQRNSNESSSDESYEDSDNKKSQGKRGRGRPKGSKNKKKVMQILSEMSIGQLFLKLINSKNIDEINKKLNKTKYQEIKLKQQIKQEEEERVERKRPGRPKGVKNKPKISNNEQSFSQSHLEKDKIPKRKAYKGATALPKCCVKCNERQIKRNIIQGKIRIPDMMVNIADNIGIEDNANLIIHAIKSNQQQMLKQLLKWKGQISNSFIVGWDTQWRLEKVSYTVRTKKQYISKNSKQGINALLHDCLYSDRCWWKTLTVDRILSNMPNTQASVQIYHILTEGEVELVNQINNNLATLIRAGNSILSAYLLEKIIEDKQLNSVYGYSKEHLQCLSIKRSQLQFRKSTMLKQNCTNNFISPIHCAAININSELLNFILKHISQFNVGDNLNRKPIHYASVLSCTKNIEILLKYGADLKEIDKKKTTTLMLASEYGRYDTIKLILEKVRDTQYLNFKNDEGLAAIHYAVIGRHQQCIAILLQDPLISKNIQNKEGMTILHLAAGIGHMQILKMILLHKDIQIGWDCYRRSPLMFAIRNNHNDAFFLLLNQVSKYYRKDESYNSLLHYAAAYGNLEIVKYLQFTQQIQNKKQLYPWEIAVLKGHYQCAKALERQLTFNPHLLHRLLKNPRGNPHYIQMVRYLVQTKQYDLNYKNPVNGNTCLHLICELGEKQYKIVREKEVTRMVLNEFEIMQKELITLLLNSGADPGISNMKDQKPVILCIQHENLIGIELLLQQIPFYLQPVTKNNHFIYYLCNLASRGKRQMNFVFRKLNDVQEKVLRAELKKTDTQGFQFLVYLIKKVTQTVHANFYQCYDYIYQDNHVPLEWTGTKQEFRSNRALIWAFLDFIDFENELIKMINFLIDSGADPNTIVVEPKVDKQFENYKNWGIPHFLMRFPSLRLMKIFIKWNRYFSLQNSEGRTALHLFCMWNRRGSLFNAEYLDYALPRIDIGSIKNTLPYLNLNEDLNDKVLELQNYEGEKSLQFLLENGLSPNILDINRSLPILYTTLKGQFEFIILLRRFGSSINNYNSTNQVPFIEIIKMKNVYNLLQIKQFLRIGADPNYEDSDKRNALHHLVSNSTNFDISPELCKILFQKGVKINSLDRFGRSPIFYCFIRIESEQLTTTNNQQLNNDKVQILQTLLNHSQIDINILDMYQRTPLHYACQKNFFFSILYLLDKNINYDVPDSQGNTPLAICLKHKNLNQAALLIKKGVKYGFVIDHGCKCSYFAYAINRLSVGICFMLIDYGYPLQRALEQVTNEAFKKVLTKKYTNSTNN